MCAAPTNPIATDHAPSNPASHAPSEGEATVARFSVSLPSKLLNRLDDMVQDRQLPSRSHLIAEMVRRELADHAFKLGERVVAGTITLVYGSNRNARRAQLAEVQNKHANQIISSQHIFLENDQSMEVLLVQGPGQSLETLCDELRACRGVQQVKLVTTAALLPPGPRPAPPESGDSESDTAVSAP